MRRVGWETLNSKRPATDRAGAGREPRGQAGQLLCRGLDRVPNVDVDVGPTAFGRSTAA